MTLIAFLAVGALVRIIMAFCTGLGFEASEMELALPIERFGLKPLLGRYMTFLALDLLMLTFDGKAGQFVVLELAVVGKLARRMARNTRFVGQDLAELIPMLVGVAAFTELVGFASKLELPGAPRRLAGEDVLRYLVAFRTAASKFPMSSRQLKVGLVMIER